MKPLVSIITPVFNLEKEIVWTIESVLKQTMPDFEMIIVDDISTDKTKEVVKNYAKLDRRIKYYCLKEKSGASGARNYALSKCHGRYIAFLDGDDLWYPSKLEKQINFMKSKDIAFSYTDYEYIDDNNERMNIVRVCPNKVSYFRMLLGDSIGCLTVMYDTKKVGKINIPPIEKRNDYALWCCILKKVRYAYKLNEVLSLYRKSSLSLSSGPKAHLLKYHYQMHREINGFNPVTSFFFTGTNGVNYVINKKIREKKINSEKEKVGV